MSDYDDERFMQLTQQLSEVVSELLDMDGNDVALVRAEFENALANYEPEGD